jgi:predicted sulfurtransferase
MSNALRLRIIPEPPPPGMVPSCVGGGVRSLNAVNFLRQQGFKYVKSVKGGITAWSDEIDSNVPRY